MVYYANKMLIITSYDFFKLKRVLNNQDSNTILLKLVHSYWKKTPFTYSPTTPSPSRTSMNLYSQWSE